MIGSDIFEWFRSILSDASIEYFIESLRDKLIYEKEEKDDGQ